MSFQYHGPNFQYEGETDKHIIHILKTWIVEVAMEVCMSNIKTKLMNNNVKEAI